MQYVPPFGEIGNAPYTDGNPSISLRGSKVPAAAIEHTQREIVNVITAAGIDPSGASLSQLYDAIMLLIGVRDQIIYVPGVQVGGSANAIELTIPDLTLTSPQQIRFFAQGTNTSGNVTVKINAATFDVRKQGGELLTYADITQAMVVDFVYNGTFVEQLNPRWAGAKRGDIKTFHGSIASIQTGWQLTDGTNGTPDLRDKMIIGARQDDAAIAKTNVTGTLTKTGGTVDHNHGGSTAGHSLTVSQMPRHRFQTQIPLGDFPGGSGMPEAAGDGGPFPSIETYFTNYLGNDEQHQHSLATASHLPPYYALAIIMKM